MPRRKGKKKRSINSSGTVKRTGDLILDIMSDHEPWSPVSLHTEVLRRGAKKSYHAVFMALKRLVKKGLVEKIDKASYQLVLTPADRGAVPSRKPQAVTPSDLLKEEKPPRVHDVWLQYYPPLKIESKELSLSVGNTSMRLIFGERENRITIVIANDYPGLDYDGYMLALELARTRIAEEIGIRPENEEIKVLNVQINRDHQHVRLDGVKSITVKDFNGMVARWYQKTEDMVREEYQPTPSISADSLAAALSSGLSVSQAVQIANLVVIQFKELKRDIATFMEVMKQQLRFQQALLDRMARGGF